MAGMGRRLIFQLIKMFRKRKKSNVFEELWLDKTPPVKEKLLWRIVMLLRSWLKLVEKYACIFLLPFLLLAWPLSGYAQPNREALLSFSWEGMSLSQSPAELTNTLLSNG